MKHRMVLWHFAFDKIVNGTKRVEMRLFDQEHQKIKLNDVIEFVCQDSDEKVLCLVRGLLVFERFDDLVALLPSQVFGYDNKEEVRIRISRRFSLEEQLINHAMGIIFMPLQMDMTSHENDLEHMSEGRDEDEEQLQTKQHSFSEVKQMLKEEEKWRPISHSIEHCVEEEQPELDEQIEKARMKAFENEGRE